MRDSGEDLDAGLGFAGPEENFNLASLTLGDTVSRGGVLGHFGLKVGGDVEEEGDESENFDEEHEHVCKGPLGKEEKELGVYLIG